MQLSFEQKSAQIWDCILDPSVLGMLLERLKSRPEPCNTTERGDSSAVTFGISIKYATLGSLNLAATAVMEDESISSASEQNTKFISYKKIQTSEKHIIKIFGLYKVT